MPSSSIRGLLAFKISTASWTLRAFSSAMASAVCTGAGLSDALTADYTFKLLSVSLVPRMTSGVSGNPDDVDATCAVIFGSLVILTT